MGLSFEREREREQWKRKGICTLGSHLSDREIIQDRGTSKPQRKVQQLDWGRKSRERAKHHWYHFPGHHSLRHSEGGWALRLNLEISSEERIKVSCVDTAWGAREQCAIGWGWSTAAEENWEEVYDLRRSKAQLWEGKRRKGGMPQNIFARMQTLRRQGYRVVRCLLWRIIMTGWLLHGQQEPEANCHSHLRLQRWA